MLLTAPRGHVKAYFAGERKQRISTKAWQIEEINAGHSIKLASHINSTTQAVSIAARLISRWRFFISMFCLTVQISRNSCFAFSNLCLIGFVQRNCLGERKEVFFPIIPHQRFGNGGDGTLTAVVPMLGQNFCVALAGNYGLDDLHPGVASNV